MYHGDFALGKTFDVKFTTRRFSSGAPYTLAGTPSVAAYPDNSTTEITAGITLSVDFDSRTGLNNVRVVATSGNGYATGTNYTLVITAGTVDSVSVVGECIGSFSIEARSALRPATADRTLVVDASGLADANAVKVGPTGSGTAQTAKDLGAINVTNLNTLSSHDPGGTLASASDAATIESAIAGLNDIDAADVWTYATRVLTAGTNIALAKGTGVTGFNDLDAAGIRSAVGLASANIDTQFLKQKKYSQLMVRKDTAVASDLATELGELNANTGTGTGDYDNTAQSLEAIGDSGGGGPTANDIADAVLDRSASGHTTNNTLGAIINDWEDGGRLDSIVDGIVTDLAAIDSAIAGLNDVSATDVWAAAIRTLTAGTNIVLAKGSGVTGFNDLDAAGVRTAVGLASANLDSQLAAIVADTNELQTDWVNGGRLDNILDARASQTSVTSLTTDVAAVSTALAVVDGNVDSILDDTGTSGVVVASLSAGAVDSILDDSVAEPTGMFAWSSATPRKILATLGVLMRNEVDSDGDSVDVKADDGSDLWSYSSSDDGSVYISGEAA